MGVKIGKREKMIVEGDNNTWIWRSLDNSSRESCNNSRWWKDLMRVCGFWKLGG